MTGYPAEESVTSGHPQVVTNTIAFGTTLRYEGQDGLQNGKFTEESIQKCLEAGELKVSATSDPASIWQYADKEGNRLTGEVVVKPAPVTCDIKKVEKFVSPKREKLFEVSFHVSFSPLQ